MVFAQTKSRRGFRFHKIGACLCVVLVLSLTWGAANAAPGEGLFGSKEIHSKNMRSFSKWTDMWRKHNLPRTVKDDESKKKFKCAGRHRLKCNRDAWEDFLAEQDVSDSVALIKSVNRYMNRSSYIVDPVNWGLPDYWATPDEFFLKDGDCEDYAISKFVTLKRLGYDTNKMRLVILQDMNLRVAHAVLAVEVDGISYILDNQVDAVLPHTKILHYRPVYSINETGWWLHRVTQFTKR